MKVRAFSFLEKMEELEDTTAGDAKGEAWMDLTVVCNRFF